MLPPIAKTVARLDNLFNFTNWILKSWKNLLNMLVEKQLLWVSQF